MSVVYCRRCRAPTTAGARVCRACGAWDPGGRRSAGVGALVVATLVAAVVTAGYALAMAHPWVWERWERRFDALPDGHALRDHPWDVAFVAGVGVFVVVWLAAAAGLYRRARAR